MKKWMVLFSPLVFMSSLVSAWGNRYVAQPSTDPSLTHFPLNADQGWFLEESYLLMKPSLGDLEYGNMVMTKHPSATEAHFKIKVKEPGFNWNSGARIGLGRYLPNHDQWDVSLYTTYFYGTTEDTSRGSIPALKALSASYSSFLSILSQKTRATWRLNYFVWDLSLGRQFSMTPHIVFHPYIGLRTALIYTGFKSENTGDISVTFNNLVFSGPGRAKINLRENFWGVGPRVGSHFDYRFSGDWSFLGNLSTSLLYGHYHVKENSRTTFVTSGSSRPFRGSAVDNDDAIRVNLEGSLGMGWETWFKDNSIRLAPTVLFEGSLWVDMNDFFKSTRAFSQDHGNLGLMGLSFNLQVDF